MRRIIYAANILGIINFSVCILYSIYGNIFPEKIVAGSLPYNIGSAIATFVFVIFIIIVASSQYLFSKKYPQLAEVLSTVPRLSLFERIVFIVLGIYLVYRTICIIVFGAATAANNANGNMAFIALEMILNFYIFVITKTLLKTSV